MTSIRRREAFHLLCILSVFYTSDSQDCTGSQQEPSLGDIMIRSDDGAVTVYYTDGTIEPTWIPICLDRAGNSIFKVICRQFGYQSYRNRPILAAELNSLRQRYLQTSDKHFLHISCDDEPTDSHILRCEHHFSTSCSDRDYLYSDSFTCEDPLITSPYEGQVYLCSPNNFPVGSCSVSTGLVRVYTHKTWRGINQRNSDDRLGTHVADSICRQLGYTSAIENSAVVVQATKQDFSHCYSSGITTHALATTTELTECDDSSQDCFGCCFKSYPQQFCNECDNSSDLVITCSFDTTLSGLNSEGNSSLCTFNSEKSFNLGSKCDDLKMEPNILSRVLQKGLLAVLGLCVIVIIILLVIVVLTCIWYRFLRNWCQNRRNRAEQRHGAFRRLVANPDDDRAAVVDHDAENNDRNELPRDNVERNPANQDPEPNEEVPLEDVDHIRHDDDEDDEVNVAQDEAGVRPQGQPDH